MGENKDESVSATDFGEELAWQPFQGCQLESTQQISTPDAIRRGLASMQALQHLVHGLAKSDLYSLSCDH